MKKKGSLNDGENEVGSFSVMVSQVLSSGGEKIGYRLPWFSWQLGNRLEVLLIVMRVEANSAEFC